MTSYSITPDDPANIAFWETLHYFEKEPPEELYDELECAKLSVNPNREFHRTIAVLGGRQHMMKLPAPTWKQADQTDAIFCYVLTAPPYTGLDYREDKGKETRGKSYNLALMIEMNLRIAANGVTPATVFNPYHLEAPPTEVVGSEWDAGTLKNELRNRKLWSTNTHPRFQAEGGQRMTEAQQEARRANAERGRAKRSQQALERAQMVLRALELGATHAQLAERLGIAEASVPSYLCRARERVRQADAT